MTDKCHFDLSVAFGTLADLCPDARRSSKPRLETGEVSVVIQRVEHGRRRFPSYIRSLDDPTTPNVRPVNAGTGVAAESALLPPVLLVHERCLLHIDTVVFGYGDCVGISSYLRD